MKKKLLVLILNILAFTASAQADKRSPQLSIFPNPATEYIKLNDDESAKNICISNMLGRKIRTFDIVKGERYEIADLPNGLYLIQIIGKNNKVLATQRLTKKS
ncbi:MAG: T9SS type A sorting domain-containing protein [Saprospiraceae bacterium]|nr:T9SS type A sorting domain-containing protein [Saprospiraceae bacterium]